MRKEIVIFFLILLVIMIYLPSVYSNNSKSEKESIVENNYQNKTTNIKNMDDFNVYIPSISGPLPGRILANYTYTADYYGHDATPPVTYYWDFGDGSRAMGNPVYHTYCYPGDMLVKVTGTDSKGLTDDEEMLIRIFNYNFKKTFMIGKIKGYKNICNYSIIDPKFILYIQLPTTFWIYNFDSDIVISETYSGFIKNDFIFGYFNAGYKLDEN